MFSLGLHPHQQRSRIAWILLVVLLPLFIVPWSQAHQGKCSPRMPACEMTCCKGMLLDNAAHHSECPCQDSDQGCDCSCCLHVSSSMPPVVMWAPQTCPLDAEGARPSSQRGLSRTEQPPLPPPKPPANFHLVGSPLTSILSKHSILLIYENIVPVSCSHSDPHRSVCSHPIQHGREVQLLPSCCLLHWWCLLRHG